MTMTTSKQAAPTSTRTQPSGDAAGKKEGRKPANTDPAAQPGFAEQEQALSPAAKKPAAAGAKQKFEDATFSIKQIRKLDGNMAEADVCVALVVKGEGYAKPANTKTHTVKFKLGKEELGNSDNLTKAFEGGGFLTGVSAADQQEFLWGGDGQSLTFKSVMAFRDEHLIKDYRGVAPDKIPKPKKSNKPVLTSGGTQKVSQARILPGGKAEIDLVLALKVDGAMQAPKQYTVKFNMSAEGNWDSARNAYMAFAAAGHLDGFEFERDGSPLEGPIWNEVAHEMSDALSDPARRKQLDK